jgi:hypothetical protein
MPAAAMMPGRMPARRAAAMRSVGVMAQAPSSRASRIKRHSSETSAAPRVQSPPIRAARAATSRLKSARSLASASQLLFAVSRVCMGGVPWCPHTLAKPETVARLRRSSVNTL